MEEADSSYSAEIKKEPPMDENEKISTEARVMGQSIERHHYHGNNDPNPGPDNPLGSARHVGEVLEVKAEGVWGEHRWPISLHITVPPGCGAIPCTGDNIKITVERA